MMQRSIEGLVEALAPNMARLVEEQAAGRLSEKLKRRRSLKKAQEKVSAGPRDPHPHPATRTLME